MSEFIIKNATTAVAGAKAGAKKIAKEAKAAKFMADAAGNLNKIQETRGFHEMESLFNSMRAAGPEAIPLQMLVADLNSGTMESRINLMTSILELMENPLVEGGINALNKLLSFIINAGATYLDIYNVAYTILGGMVGL